jgi:hypothetical protein
MIDFIPAVTKWSDLAASKRGFAWLEENYGPLPQNQLSSISRVSPDDTVRLNAWLGGLLPQTSMDQLGFPHSDIIRLGDENWSTTAGIQAVREWLHARGVPYNTSIYAFYDQDQILVMPWRLLLKYWDVFAWRVGYSMIATDASCQWACMFHHENVIEFGAYGEIPTEPNDATERRSRAS